MGLDYNGFWDCKFLVSFFESKNLTKIERINYYIFICDEISIELTAMNKAVIDNNKIYTEVVLEQKLKLDYNLRKTGFFTIDYLDSLNRYHSVKLSLYDCTYWLVLKYFDKCPNDLFSTNFNFNFAKKENQDYVLNLFNYIWYVSYFLKRKKIYGFFTKLDFSNPRFLNNLNSSNFCDIILGNSYDLVSWFFYVDVSQIAVEALKDNEKYIINIISLQKSYKLLLEVDDNLICFEAYKDILINLVKLSEFTKSKLSNIKYNDDSLKTWKEWYNDELNKLNKLLKLFKKD